MRLRARILRRRPAWALGLALAAPALGAEIAVLKSADAPAWRPAIEALKRALAEHTLQEIDLHGDRAEADSAVAKLLGKSNLIVAMGGLAAKAAHDGAKDIPLVVCMTPDPGALGIEPRPNVTGVAFEPPIRNQLAAFRAVNPRGVNIGVLYNPENTGRLVQQAQKAAPVVRLRIVEKAVASDKELPKALRELLGGSVPVDALWLPPDPTLLGDEARRYLLSETLKAGKPVYAFSASLVQEGALVSDAADPGSVGELAGELAMRLLGPEKGARIEFSIPRAELAINKKVAERLKLEIPEGAMKAAARVF